MIPVLTTAQMRHIDEQAIAGNTAKGFAYMLKAGMGVVEAARTMAPEPGTGDIAIVCGKGNNGGDGYVAGALLLDAGYRTMTFGLCDPEQLRGEARIAFEEYAARKGNFILLNDIGDMENISRYVLIIDAIFGTGLKGDPRGFTAEVIGAINSAGRPVLSVDTPSGLDNDTGRTGSPCIRAAVTVTMGFPKIGQCWYPGKSSVGRLVVRDLGYPEDVVQRNASNIYLPTKGVLVKMLPPRKPAGSKFDHGLALMVCGSRGMAGSAVLAVEAALRAGCGMVHLAAPRSVIDVLAGRLTETLLHPIDETEEGTPGLEAYGSIMALAAPMQAVCIGPGISHVAETSALVRKLVSALGVPVVLDADGINAYKGCADQLKNHGGPLIITPHAGEWARLFSPLPEDPVASFDALREKAGLFDMTILHKGSPGMAVSADHNAYVLPFGNSGMATAGSGDVLSGIITGLCAQGAPPADAVLLGVWLHGEAGNTAAAAKTEYGMIARDILEAVPQAFKRLA